MRREECDAVVLTGWEAKPRLVPLHGPPECSGSSIVDGEPQLDLELPEAPAPHGSPTSVPRPRHRQPQPDADARQPRLCSKTDQHKDNGPQQTRQQLRQRRGVQPKPARRSKPHCKSNWVCQQPAPLLVRQREVVRGPARCRIARVVVVGHEPVLLRPLERHRINVPQWELHHSWSRGWPIAFISITLKTHV
ncbi:hypothetical protein ERJ75_000504900 [Trypanosoma vivax]|nr:hypothetical protein ERJ75_000504900 [Trypanosoma vivax]